MIKGSVVLNEDNQILYYLKSVLSGEDGNYAFLQELGNPFAKVEFCNLKNYTLQWSPNEINKNIVNQYSVISDKH